MELVATESGLRVDLFLAEACDGLTRSAIQRLMEQGNITCEGAPLRKNAKTIAAAHYEVVLPEVREVELKPQEIPLDIVVGQNVLYSCPGFILLGKILEKIYEKSLNKAFDELVANPLGMSSTKFCPKRRENLVNANIEEEKMGIVNDYNCQFLGGVAGNAGLFSNITDITKYVQCLINKGEPLFSKKTFNKTVKNYTADKNQSRGLGFLYVDERYEQTGGLFTGGAIGHCGHTGQSVFVDYRTGLYVIILSDATISTIRKYGCENYGEVMNMRKVLHNAIKYDLKL